MPSQTVRQFKVAAAVCLLMVAGSCAVFHYRSAESRTRRYFDISFATPITEDTIAEAVLRGVPLGTPEARVRAYLTGAGIGTDGMSAYYPPDGDGEAVVRIEYDPASPALVKRHFGILLFFDTESRLQRVEVRDWLTGL